MAGWNIIGDIIGVIYAVPTFGASLLVSPNARKLAKSILGIGENDNSNQIMESWKMQNEQWKMMMENQRAEVERLRQEREKKEGKIKSNNDEVARLNSIINNPSSSEEDKKNARNRIVLLEDDNKRIKKELDKLTKEMEEKSKTPPMPAKPWTFPKFSLLDKVLITSGVVLIVYLIIPDKKR